MPEEESLFRSATMSLIQLYIPFETAHATVQELGELANVQFKDLNPDVSPFQRSFVSDIRRVDEMERRIRFLYEQMVKEKVPVRPLESALPFLNASGFDARSGSQRMEILGSKLREHEERLSQMNGSYETLQKRLQELEEAKHVLRETAVFFDQAEGRQEHVRASTDDDHAPLLDDVESRGFNSQRGDEAGYGTFDLEFVAGTIERNRMPTFERILWRVLRGNLYMNYAEIEETFDDPAREEPVRKNVFIIFAHGAELLSKIRKISESMGGTLYPIDSNADRREESLREVLSRIEDLNNVLYSTSATRRTELVKIAEALAAWADLVRKEKLTYATMNQFIYDNRRKTLIAEGWCPTSDIGSIQLALRRATENSGTSAPAVLQELKTHKDPPTFQRSNKYTEAIQGVGDSYGIAKYKEVNPGLFNVVLLPFLFAVMFGDVFHAFLMTLAALAMCIFEDKLAKVDQEIFSMFFYGRYMMLLMGIFSLFTGFIYNDIGSKSMHLFHTGWKWPLKEGLIEAIPTGRVYPIGLDPTWHGADNALVFTNSLKMKMSVILGVAHMTLGICLNVPNFIRQGKKQKIWAEFIPQMLFMQSLFGYLVFCIIYKWSIDWYETDANGVVFRNNPPGLLNMLIYMFLQPGQVDPKTQLFPGQAFVQTVLLLVAFVCVPWMLICTPYLEWKEHQKIKGQGYRAVGQTEASHHVLGAGEDEDADESTQLVANGNGNHAATGTNGEMEEEHEFEIGEAVIHQIIHTIEFCLGCISNTASYLRLWALSLAHAQLSEVLWTMTISNVFGMTGITGAIATVIGFALWFVLSIAILCCMEGLSALLHSIRLVWVEFGSKFYQAGGYQFEPFKF